MTTSKTQLGFLDLAAFYQSAKLSRDWVTSHILTTHEAKDLCDKLMCVIDAIRADGLDPRWHPEVDALTGVYITGTAIADRGGGYVHRYQIKLEPNDAESLIKSLHGRGYKIVKDDRA